MIPVLQLRDASIEQIESVCRCRPASCTAMDLHALESIRLSSTYTYVLEIGSQSGWKCRQFFFCTTCEHNDESARLALLGQSIVMPHIVNRANAMD